MLTKTQIQAWQDLINSEECSNLELMANELIYTDLKLFSNIEINDELKENLLAKFYELENEISKLEKQAKNFQDMQDFLDKARDCAYRINYDLANQIETLSDQFNEDEDFQNNNLDELVSLKDAFKVKADVFIETLENPIPENLPLTEIIDLVKKILVNQDLATYLVFEARKFERKNEIH